MQSIRTIVLVGTGNVATRLGLALKRSGLVIRQVFGRTGLSAERLAAALGAAAVQTPEGIAPDADLYVLAVSDDAIADVAGTIKDRGRFMVHCSGSVPMDVLSPFTERYGVVYPLQTFSKDRELDFKTVPVCIEAGSIRDLDLLYGLAEGISGTVMTVPSDKRKLLHLAAVFACNFPNYMYAVADRLARSAGLDFEVLKPLILETARKVQEIPPTDAQTGPALRGDRKVLEAHLELLRHDPGTRDLYRMVSEEIGKHRSGK